MDISKLHGWEKNPRGILKKDFERLKRLIVRLGVFKPFVITKDGTVLGGNMRLRACQELGITDVPVTIVDAPTDSKKLEYALADNDRVGYYEEEKLSELILQSSDIEKELFSVDLGSTTTLDELLSKFQPDVVEDDVPEISTEEPVSKLGEVYQLGRHRVMCGDSTKIDDVEKLMDEKKADMVFTDPPYGLGGYGGRNMEGIKGDNVDVKQFYDAVFSLTPFLNKYEMYIWGNALNLKNHLLDDPRDVIVWKKNNFGMGSGYRGQYELCFYYGDFSGSDSDVWEVNKDVNYVHPTQKPVELAMRAIKNSNPKNIILDIYLGSGSTLIACEQTNRICYGMELDPKYIDVIRRRYWKFVNNGDEKGWEKATK